MTLSIQYPDFEYSATEINKFLATADFVTLMLKNGKIVHHSPKNLPAFLEWLNAHSIENIKTNVKA